MISSPSSDFPDIKGAVEFCVATMEPAIRADWSCPAGKLAWSCRQTVGHIADALAFYTLHFGARAPEWLKFDVVPHADATNRHLLLLVAAVGDVLIQVLAEGSDDAPGFPPQRDA